MRRRLAMIIIVLGVPAGFSLSAFAVPAVGNPSIPAACNEAIANGGFEDGPGSGPWVQSSALESELINSFRPHAGTYSAWLGGDNGAHDTLYQSVSIPVSATVATLSYHWYVTTTAMFPSPIDFMTVTLRSDTGTVVQTLETLSNWSPADEWRRSVFAINAAIYAGQTIRVHFEGTNDFFTQTDFFVDDVSLSLCDTGGFVYLPLVVRNE